MWFYILVLILIVAVLSFSNHPSQYEQAVATLLRQMARWSVASVQDENPLIKALHANYGAGYLWALKDIADDKTILKISGRSRSSLEKEIVQIQDKANLTLIDHCPQIAPKPIELAKLGREA